MEKELARKLSDLALRISSELDESVVWVDQECQSDEAERYRRAIGSALTEILIGVLNPIYRLYPDLAPPGMNVPAREPGCGVHGQSDVDSSDKSPDDEDKN